MSIFAKNLQKLYLDKCRTLIKGAIFLRDKTDSYTIFFVRFMNMILPNTGLTSY